MIYQDMSPELQVKHVANTMALEGMYLSEKFLDKMVQVANGVLSSESVRQEVLNKYARY